VNAAHRDGLLETQGISSSVELRELEVPQIEALAAAAERAFEAGVMLDRQADLLDEPDIWAALKGSATSTTATSPDRCRRERDVEALGRGGITGSAAATARGAVRWRAER
jgi:hypothetical protein